MSASSPLRRGIDESGMRLGWSRMPLSSLLVTAWSNAVRVVIDRYTRIAIAAPGAAASSGSSTCSNITNFPPVGTQEL